MLFLTRWFGVTGSDAERSLAEEKPDIEEIVERILLMQASAAARQRRPLGRGTHAKGVCARGHFEVLDVGVGGDRARAGRLAKGIFARPGIYPTIVRFANSDSSVNCDFKAHVRSLSFAVELIPDDKAAREAREANGGRQDFSLQNATTLPINDARAFAATMKVLTASNPAAGLWSLPFRDKLGVLRTLVLAQVQTRQTIRPYQQLRYWSTAPFRHGPIDVVKQSATPFPDNPAGPLRRNGPNALRDGLVGTSRKIPRSAASSLGSSSSTPTG